jgi:hypothetical protein
MITGTLGHACTGMRRHLPADVLRTGARSAAGAGDAGSASVEFVALGLLLLVPLTYLLITVFTVQSAAYGVSSAARDAGRAFVQAPDGADPSVVAYQAASIALQDYGIDLAPQDLSISCSASPCLSPGALVTVTVDIDVALPLVPDFFGEIPASVGVAGQHAAVVDRFRAGS